MQESDILKKLGQITQLLVSMMSVIALMICITVYAVYFHRNHDQNVNVASKDEPTDSDSLPKKAVLDIAGLADDPNIEIIATNCTACHSAKLVVQNRATREGWKSMIQWMQKTQNLWDLGKNEDIILDYLAKNYAPENKGRRVPLQNIEWYELTP